MKTLIKATNSLGELFLLYVAVLTLCATLYGVAESKPFWDSMWWACVTATTIGYGDMYPITLYGRLSAVILSHVTLLFILPMIIGRLISVFIEDSHKFTDAEQRSLMTDVRYIKERMARRPKQPHER